jgi:hypothetical protein
MEISMVCQKKNNMLFLRRQALAPFSVGVIGHYDLRGHFVFGRLRTYHRLADKYMRQRSLMELNRINIDENHFSSDVVSIILAYSLNLPHPSLKSAIQFCLINISQNVSQGLTKVALVSHLNPFGCFFHCQKQVQVTGGQITRIA